MAVISVQSAYRPNYLPRGWQAVRLGDVAQVIGGSTPSRAQLHYWNGDIPWVVPSELTDLKGRYLNATKETITSQGQQASGLQTIPAGSVLLTSRATIGMLAINTVPITTNQGFQSLACRTGTHGLWLYYCVSALQHELLRRGAGSTFLEVSRESVRSIPILLPPPAEQRAIAAVLDSIDGAIEHTDAVIAATERLRDALLHELLTRGVPGWHSAWKDVPGLGTVPASWEVVRLGDVLEAATYGTNAPLGDQGNTLVLRMNNLQQGKIDLSETRRAKLSGKEVAELDLVPGDILFNRTNSLDLVGKIGIVRYLPEQVSFASYLVRLRVDRSLADPYWLAALLDYKGSQDRIRRLATPAVSQANINPTSLKSLSIALPPLEEQATIAGTLDAVDGAVERVRGERAGLLALKASASDALLTGRVRVGV